MGTYDYAGKPNLMNADCGGINCSDPPCVYVSIRESRYTFNNIVNNKAFTISIPSEEQVVEADYFGIISGRDADKLTTTRLTPVKSDLVNAPYIHVPLTVSVSWFTP